MSGALRSVARVGLTIVGYALGGPWGAMGATLAGSLLFPDRMPSFHTSSEGPKLTDNRITGSTYGAPIPKVWGQYFASGNTIWMGAVNEHKTTTVTRSGGGGKGGGGGGSSHTQTDYSYTVSIAVGLCEGPIRRVVRILMDGKIVYDALGKSLDREVEGIRFRFYSGSEDQLPDSIIEAKEGAGNVPAFRGLAYVVFDELPITQFGNRIPQMQFIVQGSDTGRAEEDLYVPRPHASIDVDTYVADPIGKRLFISDTLNNNISVVDLRAMQTVMKASIAGEVITTVSDGSLVVAMGSSETDPRTFGLLDPNTLAVTDTVNGPPFVGRSRVYSAAAGRYVGLDGTLRTIIISDVEQMAGAIYAPHYPGVYVVDVASGINCTPVANKGRAEENVKTLFSTVALVRENANSVEFIWAHIGSNTGQLAIDKVTVVDMIKVSPTGGSSIEPVGISESIRVLTPSDFDSVRTPPADFFRNTFASGAGSRLSAVCGLFPIGDDVIISIWEDGWVLRLNRNGDIAWRFTDEYAGTTTPARSYVKSWKSGAEVNSGVPVARSSYAGGQAGYRILDPSTGVELKWVPIDGLTEPFGVFFSGAWSVAIHDRIIWLDVAEKDTVPVAQIIQDISEESGAEEVDVSELTGLYVTGYSRTRPMGGRAAIDPLASLFSLAPQESDGRMKWIKLGTSSIDAIGQAQMIPEREGSAIQTTRAQEVELPQSVQVSYSNPERDYEVSSVYRQRYVGNEEYTTARSRNQSLVEFPGAVASDTVKRFADVVLMAAWNGRTSQTFTLPPWAMLYDPGDVVTLSLSGDVPQDVLITSMSFGANNAVKLTASTQDSAQYTSVVEADDGERPPLPGIVVPATGRLYVLSMPYLRDEDDQMGRSLLAYYSVGEQSGVWQGGDLDRRIGDEGFRSVDSIPRTSIHGALLEELAPSPENLVFSFQPNAAMRVRVTGGWLESITYAELMEGGNALAIIGPDGAAEVVQFQHAELEEDGSYTLRGLLRGRRGTDWLAVRRTAPVIGSRVLLLDPSTTFGTLVQIDQIGGKQDYRAVSAWQLPERGSYASVTMAGDEYKPYAPVHLDLAIEPNGDISLAWVRRTRLYGGMRANVGDVPLNEVSERYEIDVLDGETVLRTLAATTPSVVYSEAMQVEDGFSGAERFVVCQMSDLVGRGAPSAPIGLPAAAPVHVSQATYIALQAPEPLVRASQYSVFAIERN